MSKIKTLPPVHPGEVLGEEFLKPMNLTAYRLSHNIGVPPIRISEILHGKRAVSADTAFRLALYFGTSPGFWMNLQSQYDLEVTLSKMTARSHRLRAIFEGGVSCRKGMLPSDRNVALAFFRGRGAKTLKAA